MDTDQSIDIIIKGVTLLIEDARRKVAVYVNAETTLLYWGVGRYLNEMLSGAGRGHYGAKVLAAVSRELTGTYGKGYTYSALTRMRKVAGNFDLENIATLSQQLSWSHLIELTSVENQTKRDFYVKFLLNERWGVRTLREKIDMMLYERTAVSQLPENDIKSAVDSFSREKCIDPELVFKNSYILNFLDLPSSYTEKDLEQALIENLQEFILELGGGFAFLERQKRISIDSVDYHLDLLFYHRNLKRLIAIDLKLGKFRPVYKAQMELYLRWLEKYEMKSGEESPIGLLLCSEGNTEHVELLMLNEKEVRVAQYLTELPSKKWFADKLHRAIKIAKQQIN